MPAGVPTSRLSCLRGQAPFTEKRSALVQVRTKFAVAAHRLQQNTNKILAFVRADLSNEYYTCLSLGDPAMCPFVESQTLGGSRAEVRVSGAWLEGARCFLPPFSSHLHAQSPPSGFPMFLRHSAVDSQAVL